MIYTYPFMFRPCYGQITSPLVFNEDMSVALQIAHILGYIKEINDREDTHVTQAQFSEFLDWLEGEQTAQSEALENYADSQDAKLRTELLDMIRQLTIGMLIYDVQRGDWQPSMVAQRDMFNDVTAHSLTIEQFNETDITVDELAESGYNVAGWAVVNMLMTGEAAEGVNVEYYQVKEMQ